MSPAALTVVSDSAPTPESGAPTETLSARVQKLQAEAKSIAREHVTLLEEALMAVSRIAVEIADGGEAYPVGAREIARQLIDDCQGRAATLDAILVRSGRYGS